MVYMVIVAPPAALLRHYIHNFSIHNAFGFIDVEELSRVNSAAVSPEGRRNGRNWQAEHRRAPPIKNGPLYPQRAALSCFIEFASRTPGGRLVVRF